MIYVFCAIVLLIWIAVLFGSFGLMIDEFELFENRLYNFALGIVGLIICIASILWVASQDENKPCVKYEITMQYNAATKTSMPMRYCAQYGEWVK